MYNLHNVLNKALTISDAYNQSDKKSENSEIVLKAIEIIRYHFNGDECELIKHLESCY